MWPVTLKDSVRIIQQFKLQVKERTGQTYSRHRKYCQTLQCHSEMKLASWGFKMKRRKPTITQEGNSGLCFIGLILLSCFLFFYTNFFLIEEFCTIFSDHTFPISQLLLDPSHLPYSSNFLSHFNNKTKIKESLSVSVSSPPCLTLLSYTHKQ